MPYFLFNSRWIRFRQVICIDFCKFTLREIFLKEGRKNFTVAFRMSVFCSKITISVKKWFDNIRFFLVENATFDIANTGEKNTAFIFVIGTVEYKNRGCFCVHYFLGNLWKITIKSPIF